MYNLNIICCKKDFHICFQLEEFRYKMGSILPEIPKSKEPQGRTEFSGLNDLLDYLQNLKTNEK